VADERWQRIKELLDAALERPAEARQAFLVQACGGDDELRREVTSLLAAGDKSRDFLSPIVRRAGRDNPRENGT
jgi:hypothetical protein